VACALCGCGTADAASSSRPGDASSAEVGDGKSPWDIADGDNLLCANYPEPECIDCCWASRPTARELGWQSIRSCLCAQGATVCAAECGEDMCTKPKTFEELSEAHPLCIPCLDVETPEHCIEEFFPVCFSDRACNEVIDCASRCPLPVDAGPG
jgi:hypothetical protein